MTVLLRINVLWGVYTTNELAYLDNKDVSLKLRTIWRVQCIS